MAHDTDWDVEKYRNDHEPPEHWRMCRAFMEAHKASYPEAQLVCLAQCFANMEFLGCRYPDETMRLVRELSAGIADDYRRQRQQRTQRTFVRASDAAEAKVTRKRIAYDTGGGTSAQSYKLCERSESGGGNSAAFILVQYGEARVDDSPVNRLTCSAGFCKVPVAFEFVGDAEGVAACRCLVGGDEVGAAAAPSRAAAKQAAAAAALAALERRCYTIRLKTRVLSDEDVARAELASADGEQPAPAAAADSVGGRLLALMGWTGGGLGKSEQGITEPVRLEEVVGRQGLGSSAQRAVTREFKNNAEMRLRAYASKFQEKDLSFSAEFSIEERKEIHTLARRLGLKSKSYGKDDERCLVVSHKFNPYHLLQYLIATGGQTDKYELIPPKADEPT